MTNTVVTWIEKEFGLLKTKVVTIEPAVLAWAENFLSHVTPVIKQAATDAVLAAVTVPGPGAAKFAAALATATADLARQGIPVVENDLKAAIQIAYNALPAAVTHNAAAAAVVTAANTEIDGVGTSLETEVAPVTGSAEPSPAPSA